MCLVVIGMHLTKPQNLSLLLAGLKQVHACITVNSKCACNKSKLTANVLLFQELVFLKCVINLSDIKNCVYNESK